MTTRTALLDAMICIIGFATQSANFPGEELLGSRLQHE